MKSADGLKLCPKCACRMPVCAFGRDSRTGDGLRVWCKECQSISARRYRENNPGKIREADAKWKAKNPEKRAAIERRSRQSEKRKAWRKEYEEKRREKHRAQAAVRRKAKLTAYRAAERARYMLNRLRLLALKRAMATVRRARNPEAIRAKSRAYYRINSAIWKAARDKYRARKKGAEGHYTAADIEALFLAQKGLCPYCGVSFGGAYHIDHIVPLSRGGANYPRNLQLTCAPCNLRKKDKDPHQFAKQMGILLS